MSKRKTGVYALTGLELLTIVFVVMKLAEIGQVKNWSWWAVLAPTWLPFAIVTGLFVVYAIYVLIIIFFRKRT